MCHFTNLYRYYHIQRKMEYKLSKVPSKHDAFIEQTHGFKVLKVIS